MAHFVELALFDILRAPWVSNGNPRMYSVVLPLGPRSAPRYTEFRHDAIIFLFTNFGARGQCSYPNGPFVSLLLSGPILYQLCRVIWLATSPRTPLHSASFWFASMTLATLRMPGGSGPHIRQGVLSGPYYRPMVRYGLNRPIIAQIPLISPNIGPGLAWKLAATRVHFPPPGSASIGMVEHDCSVESNFQGQIKKCCFVSLLKYLRPKRFCSVFSAFSHILNLFLYQ